MTLPTLDSALAVIVGLAILGLLIERALAVPFEHPWFIAFEDWLQVRGVKGLKVIVAVLVCYNVSNYLGFDALSMVASHDDTHTAGLLVTSFAMAGGAKGFQKIFVDLADIRSNAARRAADPPPAGSG